MNRSDFIAKMTGIHTDRCNLLIQKNEDYADADFLSNFKRVNGLCKSLGIDTTRSPADVALFFVVHKIDRWCNLRRKGSPPKNEAVRDTVQDLHNYIDLAYACEQEENK